MEIRQLHSFVKIVELQSFSKAAKAMGYTQAAVTIQIRQLEQEFNSRFFDRMGHQVQLTPPGREFLRYANEILRRVEDVHTALGSPSHLEHKLRIGTLESLLTYKFPAIIKYFYEHYPHVSLEIRTGSPKELTSMMEHNQIDITYFLDRRVYDQNWVKCLEEAEPIVFVAPPKSSITKRENVGLGDLLHQPFFLTEKDSNYRYALEQVLASERLAIRPFFETGDTAVIIQLIKENNAMSFLPQFSVAEDLRKGSLLEISVENFQMFMYRQIFYHKEKWVTQEMKDFLALTKGNLL